MQPARQTVDHDKMFLLSDLDLHYLRRPVCPKIKIIVVFKIWAATWQNQQSQIGLGIRPGS